MRYRAWALIVIFAVALLCAIMINRGSNDFKAFDAQAEGQPVGGKVVPVLVELFTSEGCSSCPPADELLARLERTQPVAGAQIITLSEHVDYWNRLGWTDPYSDAEFSARQSQYAGRFHREDVYTPQMVVDGRAEFVGSNLSRAREAIAAALESPKASVSVSIGRDGATRGAQPGDTQPRDAQIPLIIRVENLPAISAGDTAEVLLAITESDLRSEVSRGENSGRSLRHAGVVRRLSQIGSIDLKNGEGFDALPVVRVEKVWKRANLKAVVFVQERASRRVLGAASVALGAKE
jgi:hypothetical protein